MSKPRTLQSTLFLSFSLVFIIVLILINSFYFAYTRNILLSNSKNELQELSLAISSDLDGEIEKVDDISINIAYSEMISQSFQNFSALNSGEARTRYNELAAALIAIIGPQSKIKQAYLYSFDGFRLSVGMISTYEEWDPGKVDWFGPVMEADGQKILNGPETDETLSASSSYQETRMNILLRRVFFNSYGDPVGIMELVKDSKDVFSSADDYGKRKVGRVYVLDPARIIYPRDGDNPSLLASHMNRRNGEALMGSYYFDDEEGRSLAAYAVSPYTGWTTIVSQSERRVLEDTNRFTLLMTAVILPVLLLVLFVSFLVSRRVTSPMKVIHNFIEDMHLLGAGDRMEEMPLNELEELNQALHEMRNKLSQSLTETLEAHEHESEARMQALQAQVNPHFMHNTINTISVMAEEDMNEDIVTMCRNVSSMMRYIAEQNKNVSLASELEHTRSYLDTMKLRFRDKLEYIIDIQGDPEKIFTPRLIVQPLAENAIKHATTRRHPWTIEIKALANESDWQVTLSDNGPGFDEDILELLNDWSPERETEREMGLGLINILRRLRLRYGPDGYRFHISNSEKGARVLIGGKRE